MRKLLICPGCLVSYDARLIKKDIGGYSCPNVNCVGYGSMFMVKPDILLEPYIRKIHAKGFYTKFHYVTSRSGRFGRDKKTVIEFFTDSGIPNDTAPKDFEWNGNVLTSIFPETDDMSNVRKLSEWVRNLRENDEDEPLEFPEDYANWYSISNKVSRSLVPVKEESIIVAEKVMTTVAEYYAIKLSDIKSKNRNEKVVKARQIVVYLLQALCEFGIDEISKVLVYKDNSALIYAFYKCQECMKKDSSFAEEVEKIRKRVMEVLL